VSGCAVGFYCRDPVWIARCCQCRQCCDVIVTTVTRGDTHRRCGMRRGRRFPVRCERPVECVAGGDLRGSRVRRARWAIARQLRSAVSIALAGFR